MLVSALSQFKRVRAEIRLIYTLAKRLYGEALKHAASSLCDVTSNVTLVLIVVGSQTRTYCLTSASETYAYNGHKALQDAIPQTSDRHVSSTKSFGFCCRLQDSGGLSINACLALFKSASLCKYDSGTQASGANGVRRRG